MDINDALLHFDFTEKLGHPPGTEWQHVANIFMYRAVGTKTLDTCPPCIFTARHPSQKQLNMLELLRFPYGPRWPAAPAEVLAECYTFKLSNSERALHRAPTYATVELSESLSDASSTASSAEEGETMHDETSEEQRLLPTFLQSAIV